MAALWVIVGSHNRLSRGDLTHEMSQPTRISGCRLIVVGSVSLGPQEHVHKVVGVSVAKYDANEANAT